MTSQHVSGIFNVDKPRGWTSHDVVGLVRRLLGERRVGHAGTLDPMATGVLVVAVGAATRLSDYLMHGRKCYRAAIRLGVRTDTDDADGTVLETRPTDGIMRDAVVRALGGFLGHVEQRPPAYAAIKQGGVPAYKLARRGLTPDLKARTVSIDALALVGLQDDVLDVLVWCGAGTYIRALARDLGEALGCGAHLTALRRLRSGAFDVSSALSVTALRELAAAGRLQAYLAPADAAVEDWPAIVRNRAEIAAVLHGNAFTIGGGTSAAGAGASSRREPAHDARVYAEDGRLLALARYDAQREVWRPAKVFASLDTVEEMVQVPDR